MKVIPKRVVHTKLDIYSFVTIALSIVSDGGLLVSESFIRPVVSAKVY